MRLLTFATRDDGYMRALLASASSNGFRATLLGMGQAWRGFMDRTAQYVSALEALPPDELVVVCDAYDVLVLGSADECARKFERLRTDRVVFGAYHTNLVTRLLYGGGGGRRTFYDGISMGCYLGRAGAVLALLRRFCDDYDCAGRPGDNDQSNMTQCHMRAWCADHVLLDSACDVFYEIDFAGSALAGYLDVAFSSKQRPRPLSTELYEWDAAAGRILVRKTGSRPVFLHGTGNANLDAFVSSLRLPPKSAPREYNVAAHRLGDTSIGLVLFLALALLHTLLVYFQNVHIYFTRSRVVLHVVLLINVLILWQWYVFGTCLLTPVENMLRPGATKNNDGSEKSYIAALVEMLGVSEKVAWQALTLLPVLSSIVCTVRLWPSSSPKT